MITTVIDVRSQDEFKQGHHPMSMNIPIDEFEDMIGAVPRIGQVILVCRSGARSSKALGICQEHGFTNVVNGGAWDKLEVE